jgi:phosphonate transport system permease protein
LGSGDAVAAPVLGECGTSMPSSLPIVSPARLEVLVDDYRRVVTRRRRQSFLVLAILAALVLLAGRFGEVDLKNLVTNIPNFTSYFGRIIPKLSVAHFGADVADWYWNITGWLKLLFDTILIAYLGTLIGAGGAFLMSPLAAANLAPSTALRWSIKRVFEFCRTVPDLVFALMFVSAFGLGPFAGILAIAIHTFGTLGKLFTEALENIDMNPVEGVRSTGSRFAEIVRFGALPQVMSTFASYALLRFEINVRSGSVVGMVGAGGIGQDLFVAIRKFYYTDVSAILLMIIVCVAVIDLVTERVRHRLSGQEIRP